jgi:uncharacterized membrane protein
MSQLPPGVSPYQPPKPDFAPQSDKAKAVAIMTVVGGAVAILLALINFFLALGFCFTVVTGAYSLVVGILCLVKGIPMLSAPPGTQPPPTATAIMQIINVISCDFVNLALGIVILVLLSDPQVKRYFR